MKARLRGKSCVYCGTSEAASDDHVWARALVRESLRGTIPKVPACNSCNNEKSKIESYLSTALLIGEGGLDEHTDRLVARRLLGNRKLALQLAPSIKSAAFRQKLGLRPNFTIPFDVERLKTYLTYVTRGLSAHHLGTTLSGVELTPGILENELRSSFEFSRKAIPPRFEGDIGGGSLCYSAQVDEEPPHLGTWHFVVRGGLKKARKTFWPLSKSEQIDFFVFVMWPGQLNQWLEHMARVSDG